MSEEKGPSEKATLASKQIQPPLSSERESEGGELGGEGTERSKR
jgi:hypothetical protein